MKSTKARKKLEDKKRDLEKQFADLEKQTKEMRLQIEKAPRETIDVPAFGKVVVTHDDQRLLREYNDAMGTQGRIAGEIVELESLLSPPKGREKELVYQQAQQDRAANPQLTVRLLAEKYFPNYFPDRTKSAIRMMDQGLRRLTRKKTSSTNKT